MTLARFLQWYWGCSAIHMATIMVLLFLRHPPETPLSDVIGWLIWNWAGLVVGWAAASVVRYRKEKRSHGN